MMLSIRALRFVSTNGRIRFDRGGRYHVLSPTPPSSTVLVFVHCSPLFACGLSPIHSTAVRLTRFFSLRQLSSRATQATNTTGFSGRTRWQRIANLLRYTRIPILVISVYSLGYQQGIIECTKTPVALQEQVMRGLLKPMGIQSMEKDVVVLNENQVSFRSARLHQRVATVSHRIITAAREYVEDQLQEAMNQVKSQLPPDFSVDAAMEAYENDATVEFWFNARLRLQGEDVKSRVWQYVIVDSKVANAFVTELLPQRLFVTTAMLTIAETSDELAVILGHEVSHLILGHVSNTNVVDTYLRTAEVLLLTLDPTSGVLSIFVIAGLAALRKMLTAAHSRENERQADSLGIILAARACYDTNAGSKILFKMHQHAVGAVPVEYVDTGTTVMHLLDTHPPDIERWETMQVLSETENHHKYKDCRGIASRFFHALWDLSSLQDDKDAKE